MRIDKLTAKAVNKLNEQTITCHRELIQYSFTGEDHEGSLDACEASA